MSVLGYLGGTYTVIRHSSWDTYTKSLSVDVRDGFLNRAGAFTRFPSQQLEV